MKVLMQQALAIGAAGFVGALARWGVGAMIGRWFAGRFPLGTFVINVTGSFLLGWFLTYAPAHRVNDTMRLAIGTGFVGAYTTFSTYMWESSVLIGQGAALEAASNLLGSLVAGLLAVWLGIVLARRT